MIRDIEGKHIVRELNRVKLPEHWGQYFSYEKDIELYELTHNAFLGVITEERAKEKPFIDSQIVINKILTEFGSRHNFHRQFNERHPTLHKEQVLGMQLYHIMVDDEETWTYCETQHPDHSFPHATYFK